MLYLYRRNSSPHLQFTRAIRKTASLMLSAALQLICQKTHSVSGIVEILPSGVYINRFFGVIREGTKKNMKKRMAIFLLAGALAAGSLTGCQSGQTKASTKETTSSVRLDPNNPPPTSRIRWCWMTRQGPSTMRSCRCRSWRAAIG